METAMSNKADLRKL